MTHASFPPDEPLSSDELAAYLAGEQSPAEAAQTSAWLECQPDVGALISNLRSSTHSQPGRPHAAATNAALARLRASLAAQSTPAGTPRPTARRSSWARPAMATLGVAAVAALAIVGLRTYGARLDNPDTLHTVIVRDYATRQTQRADVQLPDGSHAILAPETKLRYSADRNGRRVIDLQGQAQFTVVHDPARFFVVRTQTTTTRVLGTTFDVRAYAGEPVVRVTVAEGRVALRASDTQRPAAVLDAGMSGIAIDSTITTAHDSSALAWTRGQLVFNNTPVPAVLESVRRWYGFEFKLADSTLAGRHVTGELPVAQTGDVLLVLRELLGVTMKVQGDVIVLYPKRAPQRLQAPMPAGVPTYSRTDR